MRRRQAIPFDEYRARRFEAHRARVRRDELLEDLAALAVATFLVVVAILYGLS